MSSFQLQICICTKLQYIIERRNSLRETYRDSVEINQIIVNASGTSQSRSYISKALSDPSYPFRTCRTFGVINCRAWSLRATRGSSLFLSLADITVIELTIGFVHSVWYLPNALMPLSSLAAEPARITIPNEPPRGGRV